MSYQVIARKWRPKDFADLVGQSHISQTLINALKNERLPHAMIFTGLRGTGKTSSARILAKSLRCPNAQDFIPCGTCSECTEIAGGTNLDVMEIDGASNNGVDAIRELRDTVGYMPSSGHHKIYIIDEVHMLSTSAFNALLKTLEEPPSHVVFIMATTEVHKIPNTILSRCQRFDFRRIPLKQICERLMVICEKEGAQASEEALWMIARQGDGSMRDSQSLLDQVITFSSGEISLEKVVNVLGLTDRSLLTSTVEALIQRNTQSIVDIINNVFVAGYDPKIFVQDLLEELRHLLIIKLAPKKAEKIVDLPRSEIERLYHLAKHLGEEDIHLLFDMALKGANEIPRAQDPRVVLEMLLLRMSAAPRIAHLSQLNIETAQLTKSVIPETLPNPVPTNSGVQNFQATQPVAPQNPETTQNNRASTYQEAHPNQPNPQKVKEFSKTPVDNIPPMASNPNEDLNSSPMGPAQDASSAQSQNRKPNKAQSHQPTPPKGNNAADWSGLVQRIKKVNGLVAAKLEHSYLLDISNENLVTIGIPPKMKFLFEQVQDGNFQKKIHNYMNTFWGPGYSLAVQLGDQKKSQILTPKAIERQKTQIAQDEVRKKVENHSLIKTAQSIFKSEIKAIKEMS